MQDLEESNVSDPSAETFLNNKRNNEAFSVQQLGMKLN